jgi:phage shock protein C
MKREVQAMKKLHLSKTDKKIAGVCGGIAETYDIDPSLVRVVAIFLCIITAVAPLAITYVAAWLIFPQEPPASPGGTHR